MRFDKFTVKAQEAVVGAQELARKHDNPEIAPLHLLGALLAEEDGIVTPLLQKTGARVDRIKQIVLDELVAPAQGHRHTNRHGAHHAGCLHRGPEGSRSAEG